MNRNTLPRVQDLYNEGYLERRLISVTIELLNACNWHCRHCYLPQHNNTGLKYETVIKLLHQARELGAMEVVLTGGEVFLQDDILDIIEKARSLYLRVYIYSNASLLTEEIVKRLSEFYITQYSLTMFSIDDEIHDYVTQQNGSLKTLLKNIDLLKSYGIPIEIKTPVMSVNKDSIEGVNKFCKENGFVFGATPSINAKSNGDKDPLELKLAPNELQSVMLELEKLESNSRTGVSEQATPGQNPYKIDAFSQRELCCPLLRSKLFIDCEGNAFPCTSFYYKVGNIIDESLSDIWNKSQSLHYVQTLRNSDLESCLKCELRDFCTRCPGLALLEDGDILGCSTAAKEMAVARKSLYESLIVH